MSDDIWTLPPEDRAARIEAARATRQTVFWDQCEACGYSYLAELDSKPLCDRCRSTREAARARLAGGAGR